jgi:hypothetical protein
MFTYYELELLHDMMVKLDECYEELSLHEKELLCKIQEKWNEGREKWNEGRTHDSS